MSTTVRELSATDKLEVFKLATVSLTCRYCREIEAGMADEALGTALVDVLGIFGGSGGPDNLSISYQGAGLKIWGGWQVFNHCVEKPLFQGRYTIRMAREVYGIGDPEDEQFCLF